MLNIGAADFIPKNSAQGVVPLTSFFPYTINYPIPREQRSSSFKTVSDFLKTGINLVCEPFVPLGIDHIHGFVKKTFQSLQRSIITRGFFISRVNLSTPEISSSYSSCSGVLIPLEVDEKSTEIINFLCETWCTSFSCFNGIDAVTGIGYVRHNISADTRMGKLADKHLFFVTCDRGTEQQLLGQINSFSKLSKMPFEQQFLVKSIIPFVASPQATLAVVATFNTKVVKYIPHDMKATHESLINLEDDFLNFLRNGSVDTRVSIFHIHVQVIADKQRRSIVPIGDVFRFIGTMCNRSLAFFLGVSFDSADVAPGVEKLLTSNRTESFFVSKSLDFPNYALPISISRVVLGDIPAYITIPMESSLIGKAGELYATFVADGKLKGQKKVLLTRQKAKEAAQQIAAGHFLACRRYIGRKILVGTEPRGKVFGIDIKSGSIFGLPCCFGGATYVPPGCLFVATLSSTPYDMFEVRIIIEDVLKFNHSDVSNCPFSERWSFATQIEMDEQSTWPHTTPLRVAILRSDYSPMENVRSLIRKQAGCCSLGLQLKCTSEKSKIFVWIPPNSITAKFEASKIITADNILRVLLSCLDANGKLVSYNEEYSECAVESFTTLRETKVVECLLHIADDGTHWWDILNVCSSGVVPSSYQQIEELVHSGGLSKNELMTVVDASQYVCKRCQQVHDNGQHDSNGSYMCLECWRATGHGDCVLCCRTLVVGTLDKSSNRFYCENCRQEFSSTNKVAEIGYHVPPPPHASFTQQVTSRCISLLVDFVNRRGPTNDVLELCCGGAVPRKWMRNKTMHYIGIDKNKNEVMALKSHRSVDMPEGGHYDYLCADAFSERVWVDELSQVHPRLFQTITCFTGLHHAFINEEQSRHFIARVANALVPGGLFLGMFVDAGAMYHKGKKFSNRNVFALARDGQPSREMNVVPTDYLVAVADSFNLKAIPESWQSFRELIDSDPSWTRSQTSEEKEYLRSLRSLWPPRFHFFLFTATQLKLIYGHYFFFFFYRSRLCCFRSFLYLSNDSNLANTKLRRQ
eukprot:gene4852-3478_t